METRFPSLRPRHSCRGSSREMVAPLAAVALLAGCTTTHALGRIDDPRVRADVDSVAADGAALVRVRQPPLTRPPPFGDRVTAVTPAGLVIEPTRGQPLLVPREQVASLSRFSHAGGARDGAIAGGLAGFATGVTLGALLTTAFHSECSDGCGNDAGSAMVIPVAGAVLAALGVLLGAGLGALGGHEDRYEISP